MCIRDRQDTWYSISVKYNGGNVTQSSTFEIYETDLSTGLASEITDDGSFTTSGSPSNSNVLAGDFYVGSDKDAEYFNGYISSVVVTTLKQGESPSLVEMAMFGQDPLAWVATYKEGKTFRAPTGTSPESVNFQRLNNNYSSSEKSKRSDFATIVWLMGDGTAGDGNNGLGTGSDYHVENEVTHSSASGSSQTRLVFSNSSNYDKIADANISVPARKIFNITNVSPKASLSLSDSDNNIGVSNVVTITALFNKAMTATPTLSISGGLLSNVAFTSYTTEHSQIGDIEGEDSGNGFGSSVTASRNGRIAAGSYNHGGSLKGHVRVYDNNGSSWQQVGSDIDGNANEAMGYSVSLSADGKRLAAGGYYAGSITGVVRVYDYNGTNWVQTGSDINGEATGDRSGWDVSLSDDGTRVAVGAPYNDAGNSSSDDRGHVRVYELQSGSWVKLGSDIDGQAAGDYYGTSVSLSSDGSRLAVGGPYHDGGNASNDNRGFVRVFDWDASASAWVQVGVDFDGNAGDQYGTDVDLSSDGTILAFGASKEDDHSGYGGSNRGGVLIYEYTPTGVTSWTQLGSTIFGSAQNTQ